MKSVEDFLEGFVIDWLGRVETLNFRNERLGYWIDGHRHHPGPLSLARTLDNSTDSARFTGKNTILCSSGVGALAT